MKDAIRNRFWLLFISAALLAASPGLPQGQPGPAGVAARIAHVERGLLPPIVIAGRPLPEKMLAERMTDLKVPGVSVAVINNGAIEWAKGYAVTKTGTSTAVTPQTLFQAASISKSVTALAALRLVEQGRLALDEDVNVKLKSWKVPENEFTGTEKVTFFKPGRPFRRHRPWPDTRTSTRRSSTPTTSTGSGTRRRGR